MNFPTPLHHLLSTGLVLASGAAMAQSSVTISGSLDVGVFRDKAALTNLGTIKRSHIQFDGAEDLGSGLAATFRLRQRLDVDTGALEGPATKPAWHGETTVGLRGGFGFVRLGRAVDAIQSQDWAFDAWDNFSRVASPAWDLWHWNYSADPVGGGSGRVANAVFFDSAKFSNVSAHLSYSPEKPANAVGATRAGSLVYNDGTTRAMLGAGKNSAGAKETSIGLRSRFADVTLMGMYNVSKSAAGSEAKVTTLGATYALGATTLKAGWGTADVDSVKRQRMVSVGVNYALSKRTGVYADLSSKRYIADGTKQVYGVGLTHSF
jgi:predicted porin